MPVSRLPFLSLVRLCLRSECSPLLDFFPSPRSRAAAPPAFRMRHYAHLPAPDASPSSSFSSSSSTSQPKLVFPNRTRRRLQVTVSITVDGFTTSSSSECLARPTSLSEGGDGEEEVDGGKEAAREMEEAMWEAVEEETFAEVGSCPSFSVSSRLTDLLAPQADLVFLLSLSVRHVRSSPKLVNSSKPFRLGSLTTPSRSKFRQDWSSPSHSYVFILFIPLPLVSNPTDASLFVFASPRLSRPLHLHPLHHHRHLPRPPQPTQSSSPPT